MIAKTIIILGKECLLIESESPSENLMIKELSPKYNNSDFVWKTYNEEYKFQ